MTTTSDRPWLACKEAVISITFDDGLPSQLDRAIPLMNPLGLKGTFYLNPYDGRFDQAPVGWREAHAAGHEIGNHTCKHRCTLSMHDADHPNGLENVTLEQVEADILEAGQRLRDAIPGLREHTFCYPCYNSNVGRGLNRQSYTPIVAKHFIAGRGGTPNRGYLINPALCELSYLEAQQVEWMTGFELVGLAERAATQGKWLIYVFHGIGEGHLSVDEIAFGELCNHLVRHEKRFHVATVIDVVRQIRQARSEEKENSKT